MDRPTYIIRRRDLREMFGETVSHIDARGEFAFANFKTLRPAIALDVPLCDGCDAPIPDGRPCACTTMAFPRAVEMAA